MLKNYALCKCLLCRYPEDPALRNDGTLEAYIEIGSYQSSAYERIDSFIVRMTLASYSSKYKNNLYYMQFLNIYNSLELDSLVKAFDYQLHSEICCRTQIGNAVPLNEKTSNFIRRFFRELEFFSFRGTDKDTDGFGTLDY
ncbi:MAG TPA: hypothetical protein VK563_22190 [Puia sp.]|nr:hypothetical protein [Puia sp.]